MAPTKVEASSSEAAWTEREMNTLPVMPSEIIKVDSILLVEEVGQR